jgi:glycosyltransferase involved in cell wall biosynthesis
MRILHIHSYHVGRGGLEVIFESTTRLFRDHGHEVIELSRDNAELNSPLAKLTVLGSSIYSLSSKRRAWDLIETHSPDIAYFHNLYPTLSTSVLDACREAGVPVVMDVQDYKLTCPMGQHIRNGKICMKCFDGSTIWSAVHGCKGGRLTSAAYALSHGITRLRHAYEKGVDLFLTPTRFVADHLVRAGFESSRIEIVGNMCGLAASEHDGAGEYAAFVGRLSPEKGVDVLVEAARLSGIATRIAGKGVMPAVQTPQNVRFVGPISREALNEFYAKARFLVVPSVWYEAGALVAIEAMYHGIPVIASRMGGIPEVVEDGVSGLLVPAGDANALAEAMKRLWDDEALCRRLGRAGRDGAVKSCSPEAYYGRLLDAFGRVRASHAGGELNVHRSEATT